MILFFKILLLLTAIIATGNTLSATKYAPVLLEGRRWLLESHDAGEFYQPHQTWLWKNGPSYYEVNGDTIVGTMVCKRISRIGGGESYAAYEKDGKTYVIHDKAPYMIMDCTLEVGDMFHNSGTGGRIEEVDSVFVNGEYRKRLFPHWTPPMIEGVGVGYDNYFPSASGIAISSWDFLLEVQEGDSVIATREMFVAPEVAARWTPMVRTDRVWVYGGRDSETGAVYKSFCRFGNFVRRDIRLYRPFHEFRRVVWPDPSNPADSIVTDGGSFEPVLLRESCGTVYMPDYERPEMEEYAPYRYDKDLFYFNHDVNDSYDPFPSFYVTTDFKSISELNLYDYPADYTQEVRHIAGEDRICYSYNLYGIDPEPEVVQGIGFTSLGFLPYCIHPDDIASGKVNPEDAPRLLQYCDAEGNVLHTFAELPGLSGAGTVVADPHRAGRTYDLFGREVTEMLPGSVYIRDGRKVMR